MKTDDFEFDLQLFSSEPIDGAGEGEEELEGLEGEEQPEPAAEEPEAEEEEMPDDLLTPEELAERKAQRVADGVDEPGEPPPRGEERSEIVAALREFTAGLQQQQQAPQRAETERRVPPEMQPFVLSDEKATEITEKILAQPGGVAKAIAWAINFGDKRAMARMAGSTEGQAALQASAETFTDRYIARKLRDPDTKFGKVTEPVFQAMLDGMDLTPLASMTPQARNEWFEETWERAGFRAITQKAGVKRPASPGVARGAGARPGAPSSARVVVKMTDREKRDLHAASPRLYSGEEGEKLFKRHVWEIEHGQTSSPAVRAMTRESVRFGDAVNFGG